MPIQFRDHAEVDELGSLDIYDLSPRRAERESEAHCSSSTAGAEPVDFSFSRVRCKHRFCGAPAMHSAMRSEHYAQLSSTLCSKEPTLLLARVEEVPPLLFTEDLEVHVTTARASTQLTQSHAVSEVQEDMGAELHVYWVHFVPAPQSPPRQLVDALVEKGLLLEPFERAGVGIQVAYSTP